MYLIKVNDNADYIGETEEFPMANDSIFKKTPFRGYRRKDVNAYIIDLDKQTKAIVDSANENVAEIERQLKVALDEYAQLQTNYNALKLRFDEKSNENAALSEKLLEFGERSVELSKKSAEIESLKIAAEDNQKEIESLKSLLANRDCEISELNKKISLNQDAEKNIAEAKAKAEKAILDAAEEAAKMRLEATSRCNDLIADAEKRKYEIESEISALKAALSNIIKTVSSTNDISGK